MIQHLSMVTQMVSDQEEALSFYTEQLGFEVTKDHQGPHGRFLAVAPASGHGAELVLTSPGGFDEETAARLADLVGTGFGLIYEVDDCQATYETLVDRGVEFRGEPESMPWGVQAVARDPDGNEIVLQESPSPDDF